VFGQGGDFRARQGVVVEAHLVDGAVEVVRDVGAVEGGADGQGALGGAFAARDAVVLLATRRPSR
jgi:hypothetical protein